ncbi:MAG: hypothetical protein MJY92_01970 [Bacteroidales bacterium]|nr:hypothetical protein [Bacteroidales bacterium]
MKVKVNNIFRAVAISAIVLACFSCKKKTEETTKSFMSGSVEFTSAPEYGLTGEILHFEAKGVSHPKGGKLLATCSFNKEVDTLSTDYNPEIGVSFDIILPDSLATYTLIVSILPVDGKDYYSTSGVKYITAVDPISSMPENIINENDEIFVDLRDGEVYPYRNIGGTDWMRHNLAYAEAGESFGNPIMDQFFGRFYTYEEAVHVCPEGWRLPSDEDFRAMLSYLIPGASFQPYCDFPKAASPLLCKVHFNGTLLWEYNPNVTIPSEPCFSALPLGYSMPEQDSLTGYREYACFWTSDLNPMNWEEACFRYMHVDFSDVKFGTADRTSIALNVRCVRDNY